MIGISIVWFIKMDRQALPNFLFSLFPSYFLDIVFRVTSLAFMFTCWIEKESRWLKQWRKRYCQMNERCILLSLDETTKPHSILVCSNIVSVKCLNSESSIIEIIASNGKIWSIKLLGSKSVPAFIREVESRMEVKRTPSSASKTTESANLINSTIQSDVLSQKSKVIECDFFCSLRFNDLGPLREAKLVQSELASLGKPTIIINTDIGGSLLDDVVQSLKASKVVIIFATDDYGEQTQSIYSSRSELVHVKETGKPFFLIKMCDEYKIETTKFLLPDTYAFIKWKVGDPMPTDLIPLLLQKLDLVTGCIDRPSLASGDTERLRSTSTSTSAIPVQKSQKSPRQIRASGMKLEEFLDAGYSLIEGWNAGYPLEEFLISGVTLRELKDTDADLSKLKERSPPKSIDWYLGHGIFKPELTDIGFTENQIFDFMETIQRCRASSVATPLDNIVSVSNCSSYPLITFLWRDGKTAPVRHTILQHMHKSFEIKTDQPIFLSVFRKLENQSYALIRERRPMQKGEEWVARDNIMEAEIEQIPSLPGVLSSRQSS